MAQSRQHSLPIIFTVEDNLCVPKKFWTRQVYVAISALVALLITKELLKGINVNLPPSKISTPSFSQVTVGGGTPLTGHLMVMVVFEATVTLSPTFIITGVPSPTGIS